MPNIKIKRSGYREKEKEELFIKLKRVGKLFGLNIRIIEDGRKNNSYASIDRNEIGVGLGWDKFKYNKLNKLFTLNVDKYENLTKKEYNKIPFMLKSFLHEIAHLITMTEKDIPLYHMLAQYTQTQE